MWYRLGSGGWIAVPGCRVAMTVMSNVKTHVFECKRVLLELGVNYMGATAEARKRLTISQSRRRTSSAYLRGQAISSIRWLRFLCRFKCVTRQWIRWKFGRQARPNSWAVATWAETWWRLCHLGSAQFSCKLHHFRVGFRCALDWIGGKQFLPQQPVICEIFFRLHPA